MKKYSFGLMCIQFYFVLAAINVFAIGKTFNIINDSIQKKFKTTPYASRIIQDSMLEVIFTTNPHFMDKWKNDVLFVYNEVGYNMIPDTLEIELLKNEEQFFFNWRGNLFSGYGPRGNYIHRGLDIDIKFGDTIVSSFDGVVRYARFNEGGYGNCVIVRHLNGLETLYGHLSEIKVNENQYVNAGNMIGLCGSTGRSDGPHLHFETRYKDFSFDPYLLINKENQLLINTVAKINKKNIDEIKYGAGIKNLKPVRKKPTLKKYKSVKSGKKNLSKKSKKTTIKKGFKSVSKKKNKSSNKKGIIKKSKK